MKHLARNHLHFALAISIAWAQPNRLLADTRRFDLSARASEVDTRAKEHPEIGFTFSDDKGKPQDVQHAVVDTRVPPKGQLVIWLMGHNQPLFERISSYGLHGIQPHYANRWFGMLNAKDRDDGVSLGKIRLEAATGEDCSPLVEIPKPDGMQERALPSRAAATEFSRGRKPTESKATFV